MAGDFDPKKVVDATKKLESHLAKFETNQKEVIPKLAAAKKAMELMENLTEATESKFKSADLTSVLKELVETRQSIGIAMGHLGGLETKTKESKDFDMIYRRFLEVKKQCLQMKEEYDEKQQAAAKNKGDKKAQEAFELCAKAADKFWKSFEELSSKAENDLPAERMKGAVSLLNNALPALLADYKKALTDLVGRLSSITTGEAILTAWNKRLHDFYGELAEAEKALQ